MNYGSDPADQIVRFSLDGTEMVLKLSGLAAKNFALFVYAVLNDQQKVRGKTKLVRMLKERRPFKFFRIPEDKMREFAREAKDHGLLYTAIRNKSQKGKGQIELVIFADDAAKVNRIWDNLNLDFVQAQAGEATVEQVSAAPDKKPESAVEVEMAVTENRTVDSLVVKDEEALDFSHTVDAATEHAPENFTPGREPKDKVPVKRNLSELFSPNSGFSSEGSVGEKTSVKKELEEIRKEQAAKKAEKANMPQRQIQTTNHTRPKRKKKGENR